MPPYNKRRRLNYYARRKGLSVAYHGNYVGPGWSGGKFQNSIAWSDVPPIDDFDRTAKRHDKVYRLQRNNTKYLNQADIEFYKQNYGKGLKRTLAAIAVNAQRLARGNPKSNTDVVVRAGKRQKITHPHQLPPTPEKMVGKNLSLPEKDSVIDMRTLPGGRRNKRTKKFVKSMKKRQYGRRKGIRKPVSKKKRARKVTKVSRFATHGSIFKYENGATLSDPNAVYVGVSDMPFDQIYKAACRCIVRDLFRQAGILIEDYGNLIPCFNGEFKFFYRYISGETEALTSPAGIDILSTWSFEVFAQQIAGAWKTAFGTATDHRIKDCWLEKTTNVSAGGVQRSATLHMANYTLTVSSSNSIKIQNVTAGDAATDVEDTDISRNPLVARVYHIKGNALIPRAYVSPVSGQKIVADTSTGIFKFTQTQQGPAIYKKLPPASQFVKCNKSNQFKMQPGIIKTFGVRYNKSMKFNNLFVLNARGMADDTVNYQLPYGNSVLVGFEKLLDTRGSSPVKIGYQWDLTIKVSSRYSDRSYTTPILSVI